tara:strand:+ start:158 stop:556 length:399 start_codon:yes stop_codon:yes gene_type:complete
MAHYAFINSENQVVSRITGVDENDTSNLPSEFSSWEEFYASQPGREGLVCKRTSYNTVSNVHKLGGTPFRGNYASLGGIYDPDNDVFYLPQPYPSWTISVDTGWVWKAPVDMPNDGKEYVWNEENTSWEEVE